MRKVQLGLGLLVIWALVGWSQCLEVPCLSFDGPSVTFKLCVQVAGGTCSNVPKPPPAPSDAVRCSVSEGTSGTVDLTVTRNAPGSFEGRIVLTGSVPGGWPAFTPVSRSGSGNMSQTAQYRFSVPPGTAGRTLELKFKAQADGCFGELILTVVLEVTARPSEPQLYGPFTGTTDDAGKFTVPIPGLPNNVRVGGTLTECTVKILARTPVTIYVAARTMTLGGVGFVWASYSVPPVVQQASPVDYVLVSVPGYPQMRVTPVQIIPIIVGGTTYTMVDLGTVSFPAPTCQTRPPDGGITGKTDGQGGFTVSVGSGNTVSGKLRECTEKPLPNQTFTVIPKFSGSELDAVTFVVPGYADTTVTKAVSVVHLGAMKYINLGDVCFSLPTQISPKPRLVLVDVAVESFAPVYFLQQTVDELLEFKLEAVEGSTVMELSATLRDARVSGLTRVSAGEVVVLPLTWLSETSRNKVAQKESSIVRCANWAWQVPVAAEGPFGEFNDLIVRRTEADRVRETPINENTFFRVQEKELDKIVIANGKVALGIWEMTAKIRTPDGVVHTVVSEPDYRAEVKLTLDDGSVISVVEGVPHLYQLFGREVPVYELKFCQEAGIEARELRQPSVMQYYSLVPESLQKRADVGGDPLTIDLYARVDLRKWGVAPEVVLGGNYMLIGNPLTCRLEGLDAQIRSNAFYICPAISKDDLPVETESEVIVEPASGTYECNVAVEHGTWTALSKLLLEEALGFAFGGGVPNTGAQLIEFLFEKARDYLMDDLQARVEGDGAAAVEAYASVYQALFSASSADPAPWYAATYRVLPPGTNIGRRALDGLITCTWESSGRPSYQVVTGAAAVAMVLGRAARIKNWVAYAKVSLRLDSSWWKVWSTVDEDVLPHYEEGILRLWHDAREVDTKDPNTTWK